VLRLIVTCCFKQRLIGRKVHCRVFLEASFVHTAATASEQLPSMCKRGMLAGPASFSCGHRDHWVSRLFLLCPSSIPLGELCDVRRCARAHSVVATPWAATGVAQKVGTTKVATVSVDALQRAKLHRISNELPQESRLRSEQDRKAGNRC
jgi:hypothetical protein